MTNLLNLTVFRALIFSLHQKETRQLENNLANKV